MISVTEFPDGTYDIHDLDSDVWHRGIALADLPGKLVELGCSPHSLDEAKCGSGRSTNSTPT